MIILEIYHKYFFKMLKKNMNKYYMGLLRASIIFVTGYFTLNVLNKEHAKKIQDIPIVGPSIEPPVQKLLRDNKPMLLLLIICLVEFIL